MVELDREAIGKIIARVAARAGLELVHWEAVGPPSNFTLRLYIDQPGGVNHGDCEAVSREVGTLFDIEDLIPKRYTLEVSSPGIERGLYKPADYARFAGSRVRVKTVAPLNGQRNFRGHLLGIQENVVSLEADSGSRVDIPYAQIAKANIEFEF